MYTFATQCSVCEGGRFSKRSSHWSVRARGLTVIAWQNDLLLKFAVAAGKNNIIFRVPNGEFVRLPLLFSNYNPKQQVNTNFGSNRMYLVFDHEMKWA